MWWETFQEEQTVHGKVQWYIRAPLVLGVLRGCAWSETYSYMSVGEHMRESDE